MKCKKLVRAMIAFVVAGSMSITVNATSISDLKDQKDQKESKKAEAEAVLEQLQSEQKSILDAIEELDAQVTEYTNQITELEGRQTQLESDIEQKQTELAAAQEKEQQQYEAMKERIRYSYENGNPSYLDVLFSTSDISDIVNQTEYADQIYSYDKNMFDEFVETRQTIADTKASLESDLKEVEDVKLEVEDNKAAVEVMIEGKLREQWQFWILAILVGMFQGGIQALSRSYFAKIIPPEKSGEYFGLMDICGKGASFLGTTVISLISQVTGKINIGVGAISVFFVLGMIVFRMATAEEKGEGKKVGMRLGEDGVH